MTYLLFYFACFFVRSFLLVLFFTSDVIEYLKGLASPLSSLTHTFVEYDQIIKLFVLITKRVELFGCPVLFFIYFSLFLSLFFSEHTSIFNSVPLM